jgi:zinc/manganese transport system permease protein
MNSLTFNINLFAALQQMFQYQFMQHAFEAGTLVAIIAGIVGYFVVLRRSSFAAHALSHIGFAGAAGAVLFGISPVYGLLLFTTVGGSMMAALSPRAAHRDVHIGTVLAFMLGIGVLFISRSVLNPVRRNIGDKQQRCPSDTRCCFDNNIHNRSCISTASICVT